LIVSHKYKLIFIHTSKTAGTSIDIALSKFCGEGDIVTTMLPEDEEIRTKLGYCGPQNDIIPRSNYDLSAWYKLIIKRKTPKFRGHISAKKTRGYLGKEIWNSYFKFCVVRNPWDRMISYYYWRNNREPGKTFEEFLNSKRPLKLKRDGIDLYTIDGEIAVDMVCRFESLEEDLEKVRIRCGLPEKIALPNAKGSHRKDRRGYREILNKEQAEKIRELSSKEIALFGYEY
jgi:hypothetical protein